MGLRGICFLVGGSCCLLYTSPYLSFIAVGIMSLFNLWFRGRNQTLKTLKEKENSVLANLSEFSSERFHNMKLIKISNT
jgi:ABC-type bacteriocin/lantibiotic exporter with double-glycine peptidase domain